jgi:hypothetical protein
VTGIPRFGIPNPNVPRAVNRGADIVPIEIFVDGQRNATESEAILTRNTFNREISVRVISAVFVAFRQLARARALAREIAFSHVCVCVSAMGKQLKQLRRIPRERAGLDGVGRSWRAARSEQPIIYLLLLIICIFY